MKGNEKSNSSPPNVLNFISNPPLSFVVIFPYAPPPLWFSKPTPPDNYCTVPNVEGRKELGLAPSTLACLYQPDATGKPSTN